MGNAVPVKDLLLLLGADTVILVEEVEELALGFFERGVGAGFEVSKVGEDALFKLFGVLDGTAESLESEGQAADNVGTRDVEECVPENARDVFAGREQEAANVLILLPIDGSRNEEVFDWKKCQRLGETRGAPRYVRLSTCWRATCASWGRAC